MNINHTPILDAKRVCELYSEKDRVPVTYVCTSAIGGEAQAMDIFYRETPHPDFGNRYFGLYRNQHFGADGMIMITNTDKIETLEFGMVEGPEGWEYSQHRHDYRQVGDCAVDGGRAYFRQVGDLSAIVKYMKIVDGKFVEKSND
tara:strand:+ start:326 stop:760 length:435 start_codon:yes stop_codon:yes gene_type:complete